MTLNQAQAWAERQHGLGYKWSYSDGWLAVYDGSHTMLARFVTERIGDSEWSPARDQEVQR